MKIYNSLSRSLEDFVPLHGQKVGFYTCGPTVYSTPTIGNFRTYTFADFLLRSLRYLGYDVNYVMNLTDVGHLTGDNHGDADTGEDRLEKAAKKEGKTAWEIAAGYTQEFMEHMKLLHITMPNVICKATDHIPEQIAMVQALEKKGFAYKISDGIYFDTLAFEKMGFTYGELSTLDQIQAGARVEVNPEKRDPRDFALWKFSPLGVRRHMEWDSPWGVGFPGWHIECSAMSTKYLGEQFDIHAGGEDLRSTHHPNEIAQAEGASGKHPFVKYWVHGAFLLVDGGRMGKSLGNAYTVADIVSRGIDPLALRYFYMTGHYRRQLNFTWEALQSSATALSKLRETYHSVKTSQGERTSLSSEKLSKIEEYQADFAGALESDLNMPEALATVWEVVKSNIPNYDKLDLLTQFDRVLGLELEREHATEPVSVPSSVQQLIKEREVARAQHDFAQADALRLKIEQLGFRLEDKDGQTKPVKIS